MNISEAKRKLVEFGPHWVEITGKIIKIYFLKTTPVRIPTRHQYILINDESRESIRIHYSYTLGKTDPLLGTKINIAKWGKELRVSGMIQLDPDRKPVIIPERIELL